MKFLKKDSFFDHYTTVIDMERLSKVFGSSAYNDFFSPDAVVDLPKLFSTSYERLNEVEQRQRTALEKERAYTIDSLSLALQVSKCIHERDLESLKILLEVKQKTLLYDYILESIGFGNNFYDNFSLLKPPKKNEMTFLTEHEFSHYPFLAPFKYKDLQYIMSAIQEKLEEMPEHSATVLGTIPAALTKEQIESMQLSIDELDGEKSASGLYLFNIAIITVGNHTITFVPKQVKSDIDVRYPIAKYINHEGNIYLPQQQEARDQSGAHPTLESREKLYLNYTHIPLVNIKQQAARITKTTINNQVIYIVPEICLEHRGRVGLNAVEQELSESLPFPMYYLHILIASGAPEKADFAMVTNEIFINDKTVGGTRIFDNLNKMSISPEITSPEDAKLQITIFAPRELSLKSTPSPKK